ncbi:MAG TPA: polysaccharide deacetylase family protein [Methylocella sp.]|nr:polysaccharide deacetylase family protein [Methylocella sp.]
MSIEKPADKLASHGRFAYRGINARPSYEWPNGRRLAVYVGLNLEHFSFGDGLGAELAPGGPQPDVLNYSWREYGNRVGVWRLLELFESLGWPLSVLANTSIYGHCPEVMDAFRARKDEVVAHGHTNSERQGTMDEESERRLIAAVTEKITQIEGRPPTGWLGPWISESIRTPDLLAEAGYAYVLDWCMDDQPVWLHARGGRRILSVPYPQEVNDIPAIVARKDRAADFAGMIIDNFDEMLTQADKAPLVMGIALHPYVAGQPYRLRHLRRALEHINRERARIWVTTAGAIAAHAAPFAV